MPFKLCYLFMLFFIFYFVIKCGFLIDDIFDDIKKDLMDIKHFENFCEKYKNIGFYTFYSSDKSNIINDFMRISCRGNILDLLEGENIYIFLKFIRFFKDSQYTNIAIRNNFSIILEVINEESIREITKISEIRHRDEKYILKANKNIFNLKQDQKNKIDHVKLTSRGDGRNDNIVLFSNMFFDTDILLIIFKTLKIYSKTTDNKNNGFYNFMILNFVDLKSKAVFNRIIEDFYHYLSTLEDSNAYIRSPIILAEFQKKINFLTNLKDSLLPDFEVRNIFQNYRFFNEFLIFKENLELIHLKVVNDCMISKRLGIFIKYSDVTINDKNIKKCWIYSHIVDTSLKIILKPSEGCLNMEKEDTDVQKRVSELSIFSEDELLQKIHIKNFYIFEDEAEKILYSKVYFDKTSDEMILTEEIYRKFKENILMCLQPGYSVFYDNRYLEFDFLRSDYIFMNTEPKEYDLKVQNVSIGTAYKQIVDKIFSFIANLPEKYEKYYFEYGFQLKDNLKTDDLPQDNDFSRNFCNVISFKKIKYKDNIVNRMLENIDEIIILLENNQNVQNNIYIHLKVKDKIYRILREIYEKNLNRRIIDHKSIENYTFEHSCSKPFQDFLNDKTLEVLKLFFKEIKESNNKFKFKYLRFENFKNLEFIKKHIELIEKDVTNPLPCKDFSFRENLFYRLSKIRYDIDHEVVKYLDVEKEFVDIQMNIFSSAYYSFKDFKSLDLFLEEQEALVN